MPPRENNNLYYVIKMFSVAVCAITVVVFLGTQEITASPSGLPPPPRPEDILWPEECKNWGYCMKKPTNYPQERIDYLFRGLSVDYDIGDPVEQRDSDKSDVAGCMTNKMYDPIYLIKDNKGKPRFVAQSNITRFLIEIQECVKPGVVTRSPFLNPEKLNNPLHIVHCYERKVSILFPVLSLDGRSIESMAPTGGLPLSCSAKIMEANP